MKTIAEKLSSLSDVLLISLSKELQSPTISEDALVREVIKDTEFDTIFPYMAFIAVGLQLAFALADRLNCYIINQSSTQLN